jgi:hypothetical protein
MLTKNSKVTIIKMEYKNGMYVSKIEPSELGWSLIANLECDIC